MVGTPLYYMTPAYSSSDCRLSEAPQIGDIQMNGCVPRSLPLKFEQAFEK